MKPPETTNWIGQCLDAREELGRVKAKLAIARATLEGLKQGLQQFDAKAYNTTIQVIETSLRNTIHD